MNIEKMLINNSRKAMLYNINALDKKTLQRELESHLKLEFKYKDEVDRLNNIINELEKWLDKKEKLTFNSWNKGIHEVQRKLQELKENKNV